MSKLGRTISQIKKSGKNKSKLFISDSFPIGIKTPVRQGFRDNETLFEMHFDYLEQIKDNLKNLILTQKGERLGFPDFGTNILKLYSNTNLTDDQITDVVMQEIRQVVKKYMPSLFLKNYYSQKLSNNNEKGINNVGSEFANNLENINITNPGKNISKTNKVSISKETIYKLDIDFTIPTLSSETQKIVLYIKSAR